jgi:ABC-type Na+ efflux pump permease subunit
MTWAVAHAPSRHDGGELPPQIGVLVDITQDPAQIGAAFLPMFVSLAGLIVPRMMATQLLILERERRTLELRVALPVRIEQVLVAKLGAVVAAALLFTGPFLALDLVAIPAMGGAPVTDLLTLPLLLLAALALSTATSLYVALLAKDFRAANNVAGAIITPALFVTMGVGFLLPGGPIRALALTVLDLLAAALVMRAALRRATFERLLS